MLHLTHLRRIHGYPCACGDCVYLPMWERKIWQDPQSEQLIILNINVACPDTAYVHVLPVDSKVLI